MPFEDRTTSLDLNGPDIEIKTQAYGHEEGSTTVKTTVNPFGADASRTGGTIEITGIGTASWPTGFSTYVSNTGTIGYQWYKLNIAGVGEPLGISTRWEGQTTDTLKLKYLDNPADNLNQYYVKTRVIPSAYAQPEGSTVTAGTARSTGFAINETIDTDTVSITVLPELTLNTQPTNQSATINNRAEFNTAATVTDDSTISYQWYIDGNKVSDGDLVSTNFASVNKVKYSVDSPNGRDNSITIPEDATNVKIRVGAGAGGYGGTDTNGQGGSGGYGRVGYFDLPDGGRTLTIRTGQRGKNANSGSNAQGGDGGQVTDDGDGGDGGDAPNSGAGGGGASGCYVYDSLTSSWIIAAGGGGGGGGGSWNVPGNAGVNGLDWESVNGNLGRNLTCNGSQGQTRSTNETGTGPTSTSVIITVDRRGGSSGGTLYFGGSCSINIYGDKVWPCDPQPYAFNSIGTAGGSDHLIGADGRENRSVTDTYTTDVPFGTKGYMHISSEDPNFLSATPGRLRWSEDWRTLEWWPGWRFDGGSKIGSSSAPALIITCSKGRFYAKLDGQIITLPRGYAVDPRGAGGSEEGYDYRFGYTNRLGWANIGPEIWWEHDPNTVIRTDGGGGGGGGGGYIGGVGGSAGIDNIPPPPPPPRVGGCTNSTAKNYNRYADYNDGSCIFPIYGCTDPNAKNYNPAAEIDDGTCKYAKKGCTFPGASNYDWTAEEDDGSCIPFTYGCHDSSAKNYAPAAMIGDNRLCVYPVKGCTDPAANNFDPNAEENTGCTYPEPPRPDDDDDDEDGCFVGTTRVVMRSPTIILSNDSPTEETKPISEVKVGDYVMNKDKTEANKVVFVEKRSASDKELYAPKPDEKPFATKNHMLYVDGKWVHADGDQYPWLEDCELVSNVVVEPGGEQVLYNLWVTGDGSYIVNGYGTHSIMFDGGFMKNAHDQGLLGYDDVLLLMEEFTEQKSDLLYGSFLVNRLLGKVNVKLLNRLWVNILCAEDSTKRKKAAHLVMKILQKIRRIV